jgi:phosphopantothenoylcysteine decarboxylase
MLAKIVGGFADGLLASVVRAWDTTGLIDGVNLQGGGGGGEPVRKRIVVAAAMNTAMWKQPITARQIRVLEEEWGVAGGGEGKKGKGSQEGWFEVLRPQKKELMCGDVGDGAMRDWKEIVKVIEERLGLVGGE